MSAHPEISYNAHPELLPRDLLRGQWTWIDYEGKATAVVRCWACGNLIRCENVAPSGRVIIPGGVMMCPHGACGVEARVYLRDYKLPGS